MSLSYDSILITGANGWLGQSLVQALINGMDTAPELKKPFQSLKLRCLILPHENEMALKGMSDRIEVVKGDLRKSKDVENFFHNTRNALLFHTAGIIHPNRVKDFYSINVKGMKNILKHINTKRVKRLVAVSSNSPCGNNPSNDLLFNETSPYNPYMNYGRSKMMMEQAIHKFSAKTEGETVIIRPPWFYGPFQPPRQSLFFKMIRDGKAPLVGKGHWKRSMAYTDNLCQGLLLAALTEKAAGQTYWIADERPYSFAEVIDTVEELLEQEFDIRCSHKRMKLPPLAADVATAVDGVLQKLGLYHQKIHVLGEMNKTIACSVEKAKQELGYAPKIELVEGMRRSLTWVGRDTLNT